MRILRYMLLLLLLPVMGEAQFLRARFPWAVRSDTLMAKSDTGFVYFLNDSLFYKKGLNSPAINLLVSFSDSATAAYRSSFVRAATNYLLFGGADGFADTSSLFYGDGTQMALGGNPLVSAPWRLSLRGHYPAVFADTVGQEIFAFVALVGNYEMQLNYGAALSMYSDYAGTKTFGVSATGFIDKYGGAGVAGNDILIGIGDIFEKRNLQAGAGISISTDETNTTISSTLDTVTAAYRAVKLRDTVMVGGDTLATKQYARSVAGGGTGDIEGVTAGDGIQGGGTSGTVTVTAAPDFDGGLETVDDSLNIKLADTSLTKSSSGLKFNQNWITFQSTANDTLSLTTIAGEKVMVWAKGSYNENASETAQNVKLRYGGVTQDSVTAGDDNTIFSGYFPFSLICTLTPGAATANLTLEVSGAAIEDPVIMVQKIKQ